MREILLDGARLTERRSAQAYLQEAFSFPAWYGRNLDALHDMLGELQDTRVVIQNPELMRSDDYGKRVLRVLRDAERENPGLTVWEDSLET